MEWTYCKNNTQRVWLQDKISSKEELLVYHFRSPQPSKIGGWGDWMLHILGVLPDLIYVKEKDGFYNLFISRL